jgi:hypothetical protein
MPLKTPAHQSIVFTSFTSPPIISTPACTLSNIATNAPISLLLTPSLFILSRNFTLFLNKSLTSQYPSCSVSPDFPLVSSTNANLPSSSTFLTICCGLKTDLTFLVLGVKRFASIFASNNAVTTCGKVSALLARRPHSARQRRVV